MTDTTRPMLRRTPWHLWVVGVLSLLWSAFGAYDFTMTNTQGEPYMRGMGMTEPQIAFFHAMPSWMNIAWAVGVCGAVLGSLLLLGRQKWALHAFVLSLLGAVASAVYHYALSDAVEIYGGAQAFMSAVIVVIAAFLAWYAWAMTKRGVLR